MRLNIKLKSKRGEPGDASGIELSLHEHKSPEDLEAERQQELVAQEEHKRQFEAAQRAKLEQERQQESEQAEEPKQPSIVLDKIELSLE